MSNEPKRNGMLQQVFARRALEQQPDVVPAVHPSTKS
jgi:hypothetical protein